MMAYTFPPYLKFTTTPYKIKKQVIEFTADTPPP
jgi:hypothetical protein